MHEAVHDRGWTPHHHVTVDQRRLVGAAHDAHFGQPGGDAPLIGIVAVVRRVARGSGAGRRVVVGFAEQGEAPYQQAARLEVRAQVQAAQHVLVHCGGWLPASPLLVDLEVGLVVALFRLDQHRAMARDGAVVGTDSDLEARTAVGEHVNVHRAGVDFHLRDVQLDLGVRDRKRREGSALQLGRRPLAFGQPVADVDDLAVAQDDAPLRLVDLDVAHIELSGEQREHPRRDGDALGLQSRRATVV